MLRPNDGFVPLRDLTVERDGRTMILLDNDGRRRFGRYDALSGQWMSTIEDRLVLRPVAARAMPHGA
jgi:hypothetical protein